MLKFKSFFATGILILSCNVSWAQAGALTPSDPAFFNTLEEIQQTVSAKSKTLNHNSPCSLPKLCDHGTKSRSDVYQKVIIQLADSPVPASYVSSALYDPRTHIIPEIPPLFQRHGGHGEKIPYERYRKLFLTPKNIATGTQFYIEHKDILTQVQNRYGVDPFVLVSLLGIETRWGQDTGRISVLSALYTIATSVPRLSDWACRELAAYFQICYGEKIPPHSILGSYAGAFGYYQFMPSSYNLCAVSERVIGACVLIGAMVVAAGCGPVSIGEVGRSEFPELRLELSI